MSSSEDELLEEELELEDEVKDELPEERLPWVLNTHLDFSIFEAQETVLAVLTPNLRELISILQVGRVPTLDL